MPLQDSVESARRKKNMVLANVPDLPFFRGVQQLCYPCRQPLRIYQQHLSAPFLPAKPQVRVSTSFCKGVVLNGEDLIKFSGKLKNSFHKDNLKNKKQKIVTDFYCNGNHATLKQCILFLNLVCLCLAVFCLITLTSFI